MKKLTSIILAVLMVASIIPLSMFGAFANTPTSGTCGVLARWNFNESTDTLTISALAL